MGIDFQKIFDELQNVITCKWNRMVFYAGYFESGYTMKFYLKNDGTYKDCFALFEEDRVMTAFSNIDKLLLQSREGASNNKWSVITIAVEQDGTMKSDFAYDDISSDSIEYFSTWKEKYLN